MVDKVGGMLRRDDFSLQKGCKIFSFFGPPGSGKGTLARQCKEELGLEILSTGDLCRQHMAEGTQLGLSLAQYLDRGHLIPDDLIFEMVKEWLVPRARAKKAVILDGFPRTRHQAELMVDFLHTTLTHCRYRVLFFDISDEEVLDRISNRVVCKNKTCQAVYSLTSLRPRINGICDRCESALERRQDDAESIIRERLRIYPEYKSDLMNYYREVGQEVDELNVDVMSYADLFNWFKKVATDHGDMKVS